MGSKRSMGNKTNREVEEVGSGRSGKCKKGEVDKVEVN